MFVHPENIIGVIARKLILSEVTIVVLNILVYFTLTLRHSNGYAFNHLKYTDAV